MTKKKPLGTGTVIKRSLKVLDKLDQRKLVAVFIIQIFLGLLDLIGVAAIGILGALSIRGIESTKPGSRIDLVLKLLHIQNWNFQKQIAYIAIFAGVILVTKTALSIFFARKALFFLANRSAKISTDLVRKLFGLEITQVQSRSNQESLFILTSGVTAVTLGILGILVVVVGDASLLAVILVGLFIVDYQMAIGTILLFSFLGFGIYRALHSRSGSLGYLNAKYEVLGNQKILEALGSYRELLVKNRRQFYALEIGALREKLSSTQAEISFIPSLSKYIMESGVIIGSLLISGYQFATQDAVHAVATLSIFLAAGTRIAPALIRLQQGFLQIRGSLGSAVKTLDFADSLANVHVSNTPASEFNISHEGFVPGIKMNSVSYKYPDSKGFALTEINIEVTPFSVVAFVGASGAGKSTIVDLMLGVLEPNRGHIEISANQPKVSIQRWPGSIGYVPQDIAIFPGSIKQNVGMGFPEKEISDELVWEALRISNLDQFVSQLPEGLHSNVGEVGNKLSGGQRQRLGIARALYTKPKLLILDEATSALDADSELNIANEIEKLRQHTTVIIIAHRLSTIRTADNIFYIDAGTIKGQGNFSQLRKQIPDFDRQANLMGLSE